MSLKVSKAMKEVWEWKEAVYQETKDMSTREGLEYIQKEVDKMLEEEGLEKVWLSERVYTLRKKDARPGVVMEEKEDYSVEKESEKDE
ncbi:MAG: hypothetical protein KAU14_04135 [Thermoplasmata archaeon]|nr:hypothetical protein [Thermoplasmata archaeon]